MTKNKSGSPPTGKCKRPHPVLQKKLCGSPMSLARRSRVLLNPNKHGLGCFCESSTGGSCLPTLGNCCRMPTVW